MASEDPVYTPEYQRMLAGLARGVGSAAYGMVPFGSKVVPAARSLIQGTPYGAERANLEADLPAGPSQIRDPRYRIPGMANDEQMRAAAEEAADTATMYSGGLVDKRIRSGQLSPESMARLPEAAQYPADQLLYKGVITNPQEYSPQHVQAKMLREFRQATHLPKEVDRFDAGAKSIRDEMMTRESVKHDPTATIYDKNPQPSNIWEAIGGFPLGKTDWPTQPGYKGRISLYPEQIQKEVEALAYPEMAGTQLRATLAHEVGEQGIMNAEYPRIPFSSHGGPEARVRDRYIMGSSDPEFAMASFASQARSKPSEGVFDQLYKQVGGTPSSPIPPNSARSAALVRLMRAQEDRLGSPAIKKHMANLEAQGILPPSKKGDY